MNRPKKEIYNYNSTDDLLSEVYELIKIGYHGFVKGIANSSQFLKLFNDESYSLGNQFISYLFWINTPNPLHPTTEFSLPIHKVGSPYPFEHDKFDERLLRIINNPSLEYDPQSKYLAAQYLCKYGLYNQSLHWFNSVDKYFQKKYFPTFYCDWGEALYKIKDFSLGNEKFHIAIEIAPKKWWIYSHYANCLWNSGFYDESYKCDIKALQLKPNLYDYYIDSGYRYMVHNGVNIEEWISYVYNNGRNPVKYYKDIYNQLIIDSEFEKAKEIIELALIKDNNNFEFNRLYANTLYHTLDYEKARIIFLKVIALDHNVQLQSGDMRLLERIYKRLHILINLDDLNLDRYFKKNDDLSNLITEIDDPHNKLISLNKELINTPEDQKEKLYSIYTNIASCYYSLKMNDHAKMAISRANSALMDNNIFKIKNRKKTHKILTEIVSKTGIRFPLIEDIFKITTNNKKNSELNKQLVIVLSPKRPTTGKSPHINEISWYNQHGNELQKGDVKNNPFDFLYGIAFLHKKSTRMKIGEGLSNEQKSEIFPKYKDYKRFYSKALTGDEAQMPKMKSEINKYFNFDFIIQEGIYYTINKDITVELNPYPT